MLRGVGLLDTQTFTVLAASPNSPSTDAMPEFNEAFAESLERQSWTHYSIGIVFIILRL